MTRWHRLVLACLALLPPAASAGAAEVIQVKNRLCHLQLDGLIQDGDLEKLKAAYAKAPSLLGEPDALCLNSPGGSYQEALKIIEYHLDQRGMGTVIDQGHVCESACALIFMFGVLFETSSVWNYDRRLHVGGKLGFHTPYVQAIGTKFDARAIENTYLKGVRAVGRLLEIDRLNFMTRWLLSDMLKTEPQDFLYADTIDRAGSWGIQIIGYRKPKVLTEGMLEIACDNHETWGSSDDSGDDGLLGFKDIPMSEKPIRLLNGKHRQVLEGFGSLQDHRVCVVDLYDHKTVGLIMELGFYNAEGDRRLPDKDALSNKYGTEFLLYRDREGSYGLKPLWYTYPSTTRLADIVARAP